MNRMSGAFGSLALLFFLATACATAHPQASKDPAAISAVENALTAMGGDPAFSAIQDVTVSAQAQDANGQAALPDMTWKSMGMSIRTEVTTEAGTSITTAENGAGFVEDVSGTVLASDTRLANSAFPHHLPGIVLHSLLSAPDRSLAIVSDTNDESIVHIRSVRVLSDQTVVPETQEDWYVDLNTGLPSRVDFVIPATSGSDVTGSVNFVSWQKTSTVLIPQTIQDVQNDAIQDTFVLGAPAFNQGLTDANFQLP
jgi:hypothetical protein